MSYKLKCRSCDDPFEADDPRRRYCDECKEELTTRLPGGLTTQDASPVLQAAVDREVLPRYVTAPLCSLCDQPMPPELQPLEVGAGRHRRIVSASHPLQIRCSSCKVERGAACYVVAGVSYVCGSREAENGRRLSHSYACPTCLAKGSRRSIR